MDLEQTFSRSSGEKLGEALVQSVKGFFRDSGPQWAAAIAYYSLLSLFPLLLAAVGVAAHFVDPDWVIQQATRLIGNYLPSGAGQIRQIVQDTMDMRGRLSFLSILALLWSGSRVFGAITKALNIAYNVEEHYSFLKRTLVEVLMLLTIGLLFLLAAASRFLIDLAQGMLQFLPGNSLLFQAFRLSMPVLLLGITFYLTYRLVPRRRVSRTPAFLGSFAATLLFLAARPIFTGYISRFADYNLVYGPVTIVVILIIWAWIVASIVLLGGQLVSHIQDMLVEGKSEADLDARRQERG